MFEAIILHWIVNQCEISRLKGLSVLYLIDKLNCGVDRKNKGLIVCNLCTRKKQDPSWRLPLSGRELLSSVCRELFCPFENNKETKALIVI
jgi:hypothetical protein